MKIKSTSLSSGKKNRPEKIDKNEEKTSTDQVTQTSDVQPGKQESWVLIPQNTESRSESPSSEKSIYYSSEDADDFDDDVSPTVQGTETSDIQLGEQEIRMPIPQNTESRSESPSSEESIYYSGEDADDFDDDVSPAVQDTQTSDVQLGEQEIRMPIPQNTESRSESPSSEDADNFDNDVSLTKEQKNIFFQILKGLLEEPGSLKNGKEREVCHDGKILKFMYMTKRCEIIIQHLPGHRLFKKIVNTQDIYLNWRGNEKEPLSVENLQKVQNELKFLQILNEKAAACFSKAVNEFTREFECVQKNTTLQLICDDIILTFVSGEGENVATITYDDGNNKPKYEMEVKWWIRFPRFLRSIWFMICDWSDNLSCLCNTFTSFLKRVFYRLWPW